MLGADKSIAGRRVARGRRRRAEDVTGGTHRVYTGVEHVAGPHGKHCTEVVVAARRVQQRPTPRAVGANYLVLTMCQLGYIAVITLLQN